MHWGRCGRRRRGTHVVDGREDVKFGFTASPSWFNTSSSSFLLTSQLWYTAAIMVLVVAPAVLAWAGATRCQIDLKVNPTQSAPGMARARIRTHAGIVRISGCVVAVVGSLVAPIPRYPCAIYSASVSNQRQDGVHQLPVAYQSNERISFWSLSLECSCPCSVRTSCCSML